MSIHYIIDGYNIIRSEEADFLLKGSLQNQRKLLVEFIKNFSPQGSSRNPVTIVFDGKAMLLCGEDACSRQNDNGIEVIFSEGSNADRMIEKLVAGSANKGSIVVVTDDKGLRKIIAQTGAKYLSIREFVLKSGINKKEKNNIHESASEGQEEVNAELRKKWLI